MTTTALFLQSVKLPVMPEVAQALIRTLSNDEADVASVTRIIAKDPVLTATLMRMANSAMFGLSRKVTTLNNAVSVIGMAHIRARALSICMANTFDFPSGMDRLEFWRSSMVCAGYARWLAASIGLDEQQAWLTGLMLRLGEVVIVQRVPDILEGLALLPSGPVERWKYERELTGFDEGEVSGEIAQRWDFPETVVLALRSTAQPLSNGHSRLGAVVHLAAWLADLGGHPTFSLDDLPISVIQILGVDVQKLQSQIPAPASFSDISMLNS